MIDPTIPLRARLRSGAALALAGYVIACDTDNRRDGSQRWNLTVRSPSVETTLSVDGNEYAVVHGGPRQTAGPGVTLRFFSDAACLALFSGRSAKPIPIPRTLRPGRMLAIFKAAPARVSETLADVSDTNASPDRRRAQAHLLLPHF